MPINYAEHGGYEPYNPLQYAEEVVRSTYGDVVSVAKKRKFLRKFGQRDVVPTAGATIWTGPDTHETYATGNTIDQVTSSDSGDGQVISIEGHTRSAFTGDLTFVVQEITLTGQTKVPLPTSLHRVTRLVNLGSTDFAGTIQVFEDGTLSGGVPTDTATIKMQTEAGENQSEKCSTTLSSVDYWFITQWGGSCLGKTGSPEIDFDLEQRQAGGVWRKITELGVALSGLTSGVQYLDPPVIIVPNSDVRVTGTSTTNVEAAAFMAGYLATVVD